MSPWGRKYLPCRGGGYVCQNILNLNSTAAQQPTVVLTRLQAVIYSKDSITLRQYNPIPRLPRGSSAPQRHFKFERFCRPTHCAPRRKISRLQEAISQICAFKNRRRLHTRLCPPIPCAKGSQTAAAGPYSCRSIPQHSL